MIFIYITCKNKNEANKIGLALIKKRLAACCNIFPIESIYRWENKIVKDKEVVLIVKTLKKNFKKIEKETKKLHSYALPCILEIPITQGNKNFLNWLKYEVKYPSRSTAKGGESEENFVLFFTSAKASVNECSSSRVAVQVQIHMIHLLGL